jgi:hypothetical protein
MSSIHNNLASLDHKLRGYSASGNGELLSRMCQVQIEERVRISVGIMRCMEGTRFHWIESGLVGRNQVLLEEIRFCWKESGFVEKNQVLLERIRFCWKESG